MFMCVQQARPCGHAQHVNDLRKVVPALIVLEATGGFEITAAQSTPDPRFCPCHWTARQDRCA